MPWARRSLRRTAPCKVAPGLVALSSGDQGDGGLHGLNAEQGKNATPHADRLVIPEVVGTGATSDSLVRTLTRYGFVIGRDNWRTRLPSGTPDGFARTSIGPAPWVRPDFRVSTNFGPLKFKT